MSKIDTKQVFDMYFEQANIKDVNKVRPQVDKDEVYKFEEKIGKNLFEMNEEELLQMVITFNKKGHYMSLITYNQVASLYKRIWNFYIENIKIIKNPWNNNYLRGKNAIEKIAKTRERLTYAGLEDILRRLRGKHEGSYSADYDECLIRMFYEGFSNPEEIVLLTEDMINTKTHEVRLPGRTIKLSDRCFELLMWVHNSTDFLSSKGYTMKATPYKNGFFKFPVRENSVEEFSEKTVTFVRQKIVRVLLTDVRYDFDSEFNFSTIYLLGFYDYIVKKAGEERAKELILSTRTPEDTKEFLQYASEYGVSCDNVSNLKKKLIVFVEL